MNLKKQRMKKLILSTIFCAGITAIYSQVLSPQVIASSGNGFSNASGGIDFTIGEVVTATLIANSNTLTQGFHQPQINISSLENHNASYVFSLYPNPTEQFVTVSTTTEQDIQVHVYDANGKAILISSVFQQQITVDMQTLAAGTYVMRIATKEGAPLHSYTIIKKSTN